MKKSCRDTVSETPRRGLLQDGSRDRVKSFFSWPSSGQSRRKEGSHPIRRKHNQQSRRNRIRPRLFCCRGRQQNGICVVCGTCSGQGRRSTGWGEQQVMAFCLEVAEVRQIQSPRSSTSHERIEDRAVQRSRLPVVTIVNETSLYQGHGTFRQKCQ